MCLSQMCITNLNRIIVEFFKTKIRIWSILKILVKLEFKSYLKKFFYIHADTFSREKSKTGSEIILKETHLDSFQEACSSIFNLYLYLISFLTYKLPVSNFRTYESCIEKRFLDDQLILFQMDESKLYLFNKTFRTSFAY